MNPTPGTALSGHYHHCTLWNIFLLVNHFTNCEKLPFFIYQNRRKQFLLK